MSHPPKETSGSRQVVLVAAIAIFAVCGVMQFVDGAPTAEDWGEGGLFLALAGVCLWAVVKRVRI